MGTLKSTTCERHQFVLKFLIYSANYLHEISTCLEEEPTVLRPAVAPLAKTAPAVSTTPALVPAVTKVAAAVTAASARPACAAAILPRGACAAWAARALPPAAAPAPAPPASECRSP